MVEMKLIKAGMLCYLLSAEEDKDPKFYNETVSVTEEEEMRVVRAEQEWMEVQQLLMKKVEGIA